ncbi:DUF6233 domain-containing protein [Streptomyces sp. NBC_01617]|uniref:DUF6233 domain-containing protein n=1 Tax=Streptomyces sp. NBC_01617 TaxID=2975899 RepID=UPI00386EB3AC|nr:DUF6233 domain-containing protein [Streptomyces sp. NBC_01617]
MPCGWSASTRRSRRPSSWRESGSRARSGDRPPRTGSLSSASGSAPVPSRFTSAGTTPPGKRHRAITREQALAALADGIRACILCRPDTELGVL